MSNLLKSKFLLGAMVVAVMFVGVVAVNATTASADCSITSTLRVGSKGDQVACLQLTLDNGLVADGAFGPKTKAQVVAWQAAHGLVADGVFGPKSNAVWVAWMASLGGVVYPAGCTSAVGFSSTTGMPCYVVTSFPAGCTSTVGYSPTTGASCSTGMVVTVYPAGCTSASGFSPTTGASCSTGAVNNQTGPLSVSLASDNPASGYIIANQATADLAHFTFTGTGTINTVVLQRTGISDQNTLTNVYLYYGNVRLTDGFSFNNVGQLTMNSLGIAVSGSKTLSVKADVANAATTAVASSLGVTLTSFTAAGQAATTVSVKGNEMTVGVGNLATAVLGCNTVAMSSSTPPCATSTATVNAGTSAYTVWSAPLQINTRAVWLKGANFRLTGSAPADALGNIHLFVDGVSTGSAATMGTITGSNYAMFDFSAVPVSLSTGSHTIDVRADIVKGSSYTVQVSIQQAADLVIFDGQVGVNIAAVGPSTNSTTFTSNNAGTITINAGSASVTVDPTFQTMTNITGGATNTIIGKFKVHGYGEDVKVTSLTVLPLTVNAVASGCTTNGAGVPTGTCGLNNVSVYYNGSQVGSSQTWSSTTAVPGAALTFNLGSQMILAAGADSYIEIRADLQTTASTNYTAGSVSANLVQGSTNAQGQTSHTTLNFPTSTVVGTVLTVQTGVLAVSKSASYQNQNVNPNTAGVKIGSFTLQNQSSSESVRVTSLAINLTKADGTTLLTNTSDLSGCPGTAATCYPALTNFSNLRTSETSGSGATPIQPAATNTFSVDFTLTPGTTKTINILADTSSTASSAQFGTTLVVTSLGSSSNVSILQNGTGTAVQGQVLTLSTGVITNPPTLVTSSSTAAQFVPAANGGATNATKATFNFASTGGASTITELKFTVTGSNAASSVTVNGVTAPFVGGVAYLTGLNLPVPFGGSGLNQDVFVSYPEVGISGLPSTTTSVIALTFVKYTTGGATTSFTPNVAAPTMVLVGSKPAYTLIDSNATLANGLVELARVTVAADAKGDIKVSQIAISVSVTGAATIASASDNIVVKDSNGVVIATKNPTFAAAVGTNPNTGFICFDTSTAACASGQSAANGYLITAGSSQTFVIYATAANVSGAVNTMSFTTSMGPVANTKWYDVAGNNTTAITAASVFNYPTNTSVITN